jgi:hypothetical protein
MKSEKEVRQQIKDIELKYDYLLKGSMATIENNAPRALMQLSVTSQLEALYWVLGKVRPRYEHERKR